MEVHPQQPGGATLPGGHKARYLAEPGAERMLPLLQAEPVKWRHPSSSTCSPACAGQSCRACAGRTICGTRWAPRRMTAFSPKRPGLCYVATHSFPLVLSHPCAARLFCYFSLFRSAKFYLNLTVRCKICWKTFDLILSYVNIQGALPTGKGPILCL